MLRNEIYIGNLVYNKEAKRKPGRNGGTLKRKPEDEWIRNDGAVEAIVPKDIFDKVQLRFSKRSKTAAAHERSKYLLSGLIKCNVCGNTYFGRTSETKTKKDTHVYSQYICSKQNRYNEPRDNYNLNREWFDELILDKMFNKILCESNIMKRIKKETDELNRSVEVKRERIKELEEEKKNIDAILKKYYAAFEEGTLDATALNSQVSKHIDRQNQLEYEINDIHNWISSYLHNGRVVTLRR